MKTLQQLKALGVKTLSVKNHEATAVNPYDISNHWEHCAFNERTLPPLPCPSVPDGTYEIGLFSEKEQ